jgi:proline iminopeptidase
MPVGLTNPKKTGANVSSYFSKASDLDWKYPLPDHPNREGYLPVSDKPPHKLYWCEYGNPNGEPVMFLHGGPGGGINPGYARFFNPERYRVILFDQRGCGKSHPNAAQDPVAALCQNTTDELIEDIEKLRVHLSVKGRMHVFGGSWGSSLAMAYAMAHPEHVQTLVMRGISLNRRQDFDYFYQGNAKDYHENPYDTSVPGTYMFYPEAWKEFVEAIPIEKRDDMVKAYAEVFSRTPHTGEEKAYQDRAAKAWSAWEGITSYLAQDLSNLGKFADPEFAKAFARIENHYFMNGAFLGGRGESNRDTNYLLENVGKIAQLPIYIVQGQFDQVCPRFQADALVAALKQKGANNVSYMVTPSGHSALERETMLALTNVMDKLPPMRLLDKSPNLEDCTDRHKNYRSEALGNRAACRPAERG